MNIFLLFVLFLQLNPGNQPDSSNVRFVQPIKGAGWNGHAHPGAMVPHGMVSLAPRTDFNHAVGYSPADSIIAGFGTMHLHGTLSPSFGGLVISPSVNSTYSGPKAEEFAEPGYYSVKRSDSNIFCEMTAGPRSGVMRFTFNKQGKPSVQLILNQLLGDEIVNGVFSTRGDTALLGYQSGLRISGAPAPYVLYYAVQFSEAVEFSDPSGNLLNEQTERSILNKNGIFTLTGTVRNASVKVLEIRIAHSFVSMENAWLNLQSETGNKSFEEVRQTATKQWAADLNRIRVTGGNLVAKQTFYTSLYHSLQVPFIFSDVNGEYRFPDQEANRLTNDVQYSGILSEHSWMTLYPLISLIYPEKAVAFQRSVMRSADALGWLPMAEIAGRETYLTDSDPTAFFLTDSWFRNIRSTDPERLMVNLSKPALDTLQRNPVRPFLVPYFRKGFLPAGSVGNDRELQTTLNYSVADFMLHRMADSLQKPMLSRLYLSRSEQVRQLFSTTQKQFIIPGLAESIPSFDQSDGGSLHWYYPADLLFVVQRTGGEKEILKALIRKYRQEKLDIWTASDRWYLMLMSGFGNDSWRMHQILRDFTLPLTTESFAGYPAADWGGRYSGVVLSLMAGLYPSVVHKTGYYLVPPIFDSVTIYPAGEFNSAPLLTLRASDQAPANYYINSVRLNGLNHEGYFLDQSLLTSGLLIDLKMNPRVRRQLME